MQNQFDKVELIFTRTFTIKKPNSFTEVNKNGITIINRHKSFGLDIGINNLTGTTGITLSSKILGSNSHELLSKNNLLVVHEIITQYLDISLPELLNSKVRALEVTRDLGLDIPATRVLGGLHKLSKLQIKYRGPKKMLSSWRKGNVLLLEEKQSNSSFSFLYQVL